jgi:NTE family protein
MAKRIGLALGAGSARGLAHIGVLRAFEDKGIRPVFVAGTSIGAMIGAAYASGNLRKMEEFMHDITLKRMANYMDFTIPRQALMEGDKIMELLHELIPISDFGALEIPFCAIACDIHTGEEVQLREGDLHQAVRASISLPGIFLPVFRENRWLVDGGLVNPIPVSVVRDFGVDVVVAVDLNHDVLDANGMKRGSKAKKALKKSSNAKLIGEAFENHTVETGPLNRPAEESHNWVMNAVGGRFREMERSVKDTINVWLSDDKKSKPVGPSIFDALAFSIDIMTVQITRRNLETTPPDHVITPSVGHLGLFDYDEAEPTIKDGYKRTIQLIEEKGLDR